MHELSLCRSICRIGLRVCDGRAVQQVTVDVGALRQVVPAALIQAWQFVTADTLLADSRLVVNDIPAVITCQVCGARTTLRQPFMVCGSCGSADVQVLSGREFLVRSIDVDDRRRPRKQDKEQ